MNNPKSALSSLLTQRHALHRLVRRIVRISSDADDVVQEAYLKLLERPIAERDSKAAPGYLFVIARNLAADIGRQTAREDRRASALRALSAQLDASEPGADELVFVQQASERLRNALRELPRRTQEAFLLCRIEGLSHENIAKLLDVTVRTIERDIASAIAHLKKSLFNSERTP